MDTPGALVATIAPVLIASVLGAAGSILSIYLQTKKRRANRGMSLDERIQVSLRKMNEASQEVNSVIQNLVQDIHTRQTGLKELTNRYRLLSKEEDELTKRVTALKQVPIPVAKYFKEISESTIQQAERKRARRDITVFISGIVVTTIVEILLKMVGLG